MVLAAVLIIHIEIEPSGEKRVWEENTIEQPTMATSCQSKEFEEMERKLFGKENPKYVGHCKSRY